MSDSDRPPSSPGDLDPTKGQEPDEPSIDAPSSNVPSPNAQSHSERAAHAASPSASSATAPSPTAPALTIQKEPSSSGALRWLKLAGGVSLLLGALGVAGVALVFNRFTQDLPSVDELTSNYSPPQVTRVLARDGALLASLFVERRTVIELEQVPSAAKLAFLAAEDAGFYEHEGLNYLGMLRALAVNLRAGRKRQGGSTITQQVVKNILLDSERSYRRKVRETVLARRLEQELSKDEIFGLYLNHIYMGHGRYGVEEASRYYFGKRAMGLSLSEAALLAGLTAAPERYSPRKHLDRALQRRAYVLGQMLKKKFITRALYDEAKGAVVRLAPPVDAESELSPEIVEKARSVLKQAVGGEGSLGGYVVKTTLDPALQRAAREAVRTGLDSYSTRYGLKPPYTRKHRRLWGKVFTGTPKRNKIYLGRVMGLDDKQSTVTLQVGRRIGELRLDREPRYNPNKLPPSKFTKLGAVLRVGVLDVPQGDAKLSLRAELGPQAALVAIDVRSREVRALIGSYEAQVGGLDRSRHAQRQPGSVFKGLLYAYALDTRGVTPATVLKVKPFVPHGQKEEIDSVNLRDALAMSQNEASEQLLKRVGAENVVRFAHAMGIESKLGATKALALGAYEVNLLEMANAYASLAAGGRFEPAVLILGIHDPSGRSIPLAQPLPARRVLDADVAYLATSLLTSVVQYGTGKRARRLGRSLAGKTGTTNRSKDAWFVGFSPEIVTAVWVGYDDARSLGRHESGASAALPIWIDFMEVAHRGSPKTDFAVPDTIETAKIDPVSGLLAYEGQEMARVEQFLRGTVPAKFAEPDGGVEKPADPESPDAPSSPDEGASGNDDGDWDDPGDDPPPPF